MDVNNIICNNYLPIYRTWRDCNSFSVVYPTVSHHAIRVSYVSCTVLVLCMVVAIGIDAAVFNTHMQVLRIIVVSIHS